MVEIRASNSSKYDHVEFKILSGLIMIKSQPVRAAFQEFKKIEICERILQYFARRSFLKYDLE